MHCRVFPSGILIKKRTQNPKDNFFIPTLVNFLIKISLIGGISRCWISPMSPSSSMHIWTYIKKHTGTGRCTLGLELIQSVEDQTINTCWVYDKNLQKFPFIVKTFYQDIPTELICVFLRQFLRKIRTPNNKNIAISYRCQRFTVNLLKTRILLPTVIHRVSFIFQAVNGSSIYSHEIVMEYSANKNKQDSIRCRLLKCAN